MKCADMTRQLLAVFWHESRRLFLHADLRLLVFSAPLFYGVLLSSVYLVDSLGDIRVGVIDRDGTRLSRLMVRWLDASSGIRTVGAYENIGDARNDMLDGHMDGYVVIPEGFTDEIKRGSDARTLLAVNAANIIQINPILMSFSQATQTVSAALSIRYAQKKGNGFRRAFAMSQAVQTNVSFAFNPDLEYSVFILPGLLFMVLQQILLVALVFSITEKGGEGNAIAPSHEWKKGGVDRRLMVFGKMGPHVLAQLLYGVFFTWGLLPAFGIHPRSAPLLIAVFLLVSLTAISAFAGWISRFFSNATYALTALMFFSVPAFFLSGYSWPESALPDWLQAVSWLLPSTHILGPFRLLVLGDISWSEMAYPFAGLVWLVILYGGLLVLAPGSRKIGG